MWEPVALPYKHETRAVTLPSAEEIRACSIVIQENLASKIVAVNDQIVAKYGGGVPASEGQALIFLEQHVPNVPAPRLYAMYHDSGQLFLVMQRAPGSQLDRLWPTLTTGEKQCIVTKLHRIFEYLRKAECPWPHFFGSLDGSGVHHHLFYSQKGDRKYLGPFYDESAFVKGLTDNFRAWVERNNHPVFKATFYETYLSRVLRNHQAVLTHGDVQRRNILVAENGRCLQNREESCFDIVLVDWEMAGWLPDFWEYFCASTMFDVVGWDDDWCLHVESSYQYGLPRRPWCVCLTRIWDTDRVITL